MYAWCIASSINVCMKEGSRDGVRQTGQRKKNITMEKVKNSNMKDQWIEWIDIVSGGVQDPTKRVSLKNNIVKWYLTRSEQGGSCRKIVICMSWEKMGKTTSMLMLVIEREREDFSCLSRGVDLSSSGEAAAIGSDEELIAVARGSHVVSVALDPGLGIEPGKDVLEELISVALGDTKLSDPDGLVEGVVELVEIVLEVLGLGPGVVVGDDKVDLAVAAAVHEGLEPVDALAGLVAIGHSGGADAEALVGKGLDELAVRVDGSGNVHVGASTTDLVRLVEAEDVRDLVVLAGVGNVVGPG